jgi:hypothetical protein
MTGKDNTITLEGTNILTTEAEYQIVITDGSDEQAYVKPTGTYTLTGAEDFVVFPYTWEVKSKAEFDQALASPATSKITFGSDITGDLTVVQKPGVKFTIDGNGKSLKGYITVDGKSESYTTAGLTIKNINFNADTINADACIRLGDGTNATRYTCNVTAENCTFDVNGAAGVKSYTGGDKNLIIKDCTATSKAHSLVQAAGIDNIKVEGCTVKSKNGMNFNQSENVAIERCTVDVKGYAVRFGVSSGTFNTAETYSITDSSLKSACEEEGDAVIVLRATADNATLTIVNTTIEGTPKFINSAANAKIVQDGVAYAWTELKDILATRYDGDIFESGYMENALWLNNYVFSGDAAIVIEDKKYNAIIVENCSGEFQNDVITIKNDNSSVMCLQNLNLTLAEGKKLIKTANKTYQVFMANITINGEKMTTESMAKYLENVEWYQVVEEI